MDNIRDMTPDDAKTVLAIYDYGLRTRNATFETTVPSWSAWDAGHLDFSRLVFERDKQVIGWAALAPMSRRHCYRGVAEVSIYVAEGFSGQGIGSTLLKRVIESSEKNGIWTLFASVFPENDATVRLHLRHGFRQMGTRRRIAQLDGVWRDTLILERRSEKVGTD